MTATAKKFRTPAGRSSAWLAIPAALLVASPAWGAPFEDIEKPKPVFSPSESGFQARVIPRAKSTSIVIDFSAEGGRLTDVRPAEVDAAATSGLNLKDFRSGFFQVSLEGLPPGAEATVRIASDFFTKGTKFWALSSRPAQAWNDARAASTPLSDRLVALAIRIRDGGELDMDGHADGKISLVGGPRDSFWGYALGTLFIRLFGIFIVLGLLQTGMMVSGMLFRRFVGDETSEPCPAAPQSVPRQAQAPAELDEKTAAAVGVALHLHLTHEQARAEVSLAQQGLSPWARQGRERIMVDRFISFRRSGR